MSLSLQCDGSNERHFSTLSRHTSDESRDVYLWSDLFSRTSFSCRFGMKAKRPADASLVSGCGDAQGAYGLCTNISFRTLNLQRTCSSFLTGRICQEKRKKIHSAIWSGLSTRIRAVFSLLDSPMMRGGKRNYLFDPGLRSKLGPQNSKCRATHIRAGLSDVARQ